MADSTKRPLIVIGSIILLLAAGLWFFWPRPLPPPDESRRLNHPAGYSIIVPEHFESRISTNGDRTYRDGVTLFDARYHDFPPTLAVQLLRGEPDLNALSNRGFKIKSTFQGKDALVFNGPTGRDAGTYWNYRLVVKFGDDWFEIGAADPQYFDFKTHALPGYLETFRYQPRAASPPATAPTTAPTTQPTTKGGGT